MSAASEFGPLSDAQLADTFARAKTEAFKKDKRLKTITAELVRRGKAQYLGATFVVVKVEGEQARIDTQAVIAEMGQPWYDAHKKVGSKVTWAISAADKVVPAVPAAKDLPKPARRRRSPATAEG